jgi:RNA polymerase sigma-70 factor (ECF subfamily)
VAIWIMDWKPAFGLAATPGSGAVVLGAAERERPGSAHLVGMALSEKAIRPALKRAQLGERKAFGELFEHFDADVTRLCRRLLGDVSAAEDAKSEVFLRAQRSFASYDSGRPFRRWLLSIAGHYCTDQLRRRQTEARIFDPGELEQEALPSNAPSPLRLVLRYQAELDYAAIGEILELPRDRIGTLLFRGKARLRKDLAGAAGGDSKR